MNQKEHDILKVKNLIQALDLPERQYIYEWLLTHIKLREYEDLLIEKHVKELGLSRRALHVLETNGIHSVDQLMKLSNNWDNIKMLKGVGEVVFVELQKKVNEVELILTGSR